MQILKEFFTSSSGLASARQGLGLGWGISALSGVAILLGAKGAAACHNTPPKHQSNPSSACSFMTDGVKECECRTCTIDEACKVHCTHWECCVCA